MPEDLMKFYIKALSVVKDMGYEDEINTVERRTFDQLTAHNFYLDYVWVIVNSGMKNQVAQGIYDRYFQSGQNLTKIGHPGKRKAIAQAKRKFMHWYMALKKAEDKVEYLQTLPWIGPITKYHLARNVGLDVVKPDRHMVRLAEYFNFNNPHELCQWLVERTNWRIGTIDVILWRYCNLTGWRPPEASGGE